MVQFILDITRMDKYFLLILMDKSSTIKKTTLVLTFN